MMKTKTILTAILFLALGAENIFAQVIVSPGDTICLGGSTILTASGIMSGNALQFDGVNDFVSASVLDLSSGNTMTIEAWVYTTDITSQTWYSIIRQNSSIYPDFLLAFQNTGTTLAFGVYTTAYLELDVSIIPSNYTDGWHHIAAVYDGSTQKLYVDGTEVGSQSKTGNIRLGTGTIMRIGTNIPTAENFVGQLDEVRIWNVARTQSEIITAMFTTIDGNTPGLLAYWMFDECSDTTAIDATGNGNDGTLMNDPVRIVPSTAPLNPYSSYSWSPATGLSSTTGSTVTASPATSTTYTVTIVGVDTTCTGQTEMVTVTVDNCTGMADLDFINSIKIYPNPNSGEFTLFTNHEFNPAHAGRIMIYDVLGRVVWSVVSKDLAMNTNEIKIDIRDHPAGIYQLQIITEKGIVARKIINQ